MNREHLMDIFNQALSAVDPYESVVKSLRVENDKLFAAGTIYDLDCVDRIIVVRRREGLYSGWRSAVEAGPGQPDCRRPRDCALWTDIETPRRIEIAEASHPLPDEAGVHATSRSSTWCGRPTRRQLVICLLSGGGSALLVAPLRVSRLEDKQKTTELLLKSGCSIAELNAVRKHLSAVKGGRLAQAACPASSFRLSSPMSSETTSM